MKMSRLEKMFVNSERHARANIKLLEKFLPEIDIRNINTVLEIGCGAGGVARYLCDTYGWRVTGTDVDPAQIELADKLYGEKPGLQYRVADATRLPFEAQRFDLVVLFKVLHHIRHWPEALGEIDRVLKPGGYFLLNDLQLSRWLQPLLRPLARNSGIYHWRDIETSLRELGFEIIARRQPAGILVKHFALLSRKKSN